MKIKKKVTCIGKVRPYKTKYIRSGRIFTQTIARLYKRARFTSQVVNEMSVPLNFHNFSSQSAEQSNLNFSARDKLYF